MRPLLIVLENLCFRIEYRAIENIVLAVQASYLSITHNFYVLYLDKPALCHAAEPFMVFEADLVQLASGRVARA